MLVPTKIEGVPQGKHKHIHTSPERAHLTPSLLSLGVAYLISFSTGVIFFTVVLVGLFQGFKKIQSGALEPLKFKDCALPG